MPRPIPEDTKYLLLELARRYNIALEDLINRRHKQESAIRTVLVAVLRDQGFSMAEIGDLIGRHHTTISHLLGHNVDRASELYVQVLQLSQNAYAKRLVLRCAVRPRKEDPIEPL